MENIEDDLELLEIWRAIENKCHSVNEQLHVNDVLDGDTAITFKCDSEQHTVEVLKDGARIKFFKFAYPCETEKDAALFSLQGDRFLEYASNVLLTLDERYIEHSRQKLGVTTEPDRHNRDIDLKAVDVWSFIIGCCKSFNDLFELKLDDLNIKLKYPMLERGEPIIYLQENDKDIDSFKFTYPCYSESELSELKGQALEFASCIQDITLSRTAAYLKGGKR